MILRDVILDFLPMDEYRTTDQVMAHVDEAYKFSSSRPTTEMVVATLDALRRERRVAHLMVRSVSSYRRRSDLEYRQLLAEINGQQGRLL